MDESRSGFDLPITIEYTAPMWLAPIIYFCHIGAIICLFVSNLSTLFSVLLTIFIIIGLYFWIQNNQRITSPLKVILNNKGEWKVIVGDGNAIKTSLVSACILFPDLIILRLKDGNRKKYDLILSNANLDKKSLRRLRVRLYFPRKAT